MRQRLFYWLTWRLSLLICLALLFALPGQVLADEAVPESYGTNDFLDLGEALSTESLEDISGRQKIEIEEIDIQLNNMQLDADLKENMLISNTTGMNTIADDAFASARGIATVIQNSGNQVIINNALIVNMSVD